MEISKAVTLARKHLNANGLGHVPVNVSGTKGALGQCRFKRVNGKAEVHDIRLSRHWVRHLPDADVEDTILHEIAHAIAGRAAGHGPKWRAACRKLGLAPSRLFSQSSEGVKSRDIHKQFANYLMVCKKRELSCTWEYPFDRMTDRRRREIRLGACPKCKSPLTVLTRR